MTFDRVPLFLLFCQFGQKDAIWKRNAQEGQSANLVKQIKSTYILLPPFRCLVLLPCYTQINVPIICVS